ncbi:SAM-dependent methyltransferase [Actinokineospora guangxiensis]|uniref:SAM-dependent methyltransferase n=1 Tax=Actinokineospora guangxiensis TaxID=1490288 RepID=A0ABW0ESR5_9PSEU
MIKSDMDPTEYWEGRYQENARFWSGKPNKLLVREVEDLTPGTALDLGCGEGGDAVWLAARGWRVTGVDISETALKRSAAFAEESGVADRISFERHELGKTFPEGEFDLVSAQFLQSPVAFDQDGVLSQAAGAVAVGGTLLVVMHGSGPSWHKQPTHVEFPTLEAVVEVLSLPESAWKTEKVEGVVSDFPSPEGEPGTRVDNVWRWTRTA